MKLTKWKAVAVSAAVAGLAFVGSPAQAGTTGNIADTSTGTEWDAACLLNAGITAMPDTTSPGTSPCTITTYDGSEEAIDLASAELSNSGTQLVARFTLDQAPPTPGTTSPTAADLPAANFVGGSYFLMFQNKNTQTNVHNGTGGCPRNPTGTVYDQQESWKDGFHHFVSFHFGFDGTKWIHSAQVGTYAPDGGFGFDELGVSGSAGVWANDDPQMVFGTNWNVTYGGNTVTVTVDGVVGQSDTTNCATGVLKTAYARTGDVIANVKAITTADATVTLPVTIPLSITCGLTGGLICESDITSIGGFVFFADQTSGNSTAGILAPALPFNNTGTSFTRAAQGNLSSWMLDIDTLGPGPTCPTPTFGGLIPVTNPLFTPDTACHIDDDPVARGSILAEFWDTAYGFTM